MNAKQCLRKLVWIVVVIFVFLTLLLQVLEFDALQHAIFCGFNALLFTVLLVFDVILKNSHDIATDRAGIILWLVVMFSSLFYI